ncbi:sensor histidine kinase [Streptomyces pactum]|uniref:histidine kinase n=1 Tax=Streptomyces pactum TaxID=68249 RepID=A0ABS0NSB6_9ACTN|nr:histidine kinase [Streptomyces pactum]MBH5338107.1 sensor histidine kinase [Streptomyces pactum]
MVPRTLPDALVRRPLRFWCSRWPWRAAASLLLGALPGVAAGLAAAGLVASWRRTGLVATMVSGLLLFASVVLAAGAVERRRLRLTHPDAVPARAGLRDAGGWRAAGYGALSACALGWVDLAVVLVCAGVPGVLMSAPWQPEAGPWAVACGPVAGLLLLPVAAYPVAAWAAARSAVALAVLAPGERELREVRQSRARLVDAFDAERRRIERDLHDGAQACLVALTMKLGLARLDLPAGSRAAREVAEAHRMAKEALAGLREVIHGIHPQVLTERGLAAAVRDAAGRTAVPVEPDVVLPHRLPGPVEVAAYFAVCEALTNMARHSGATAGRVTGRLRGGVLVVEVSDDGRGGADPAAGSGLTGLADRVAAVNGRMLLSSPAGGPTLVRVEIPCGN